MAGPEKWFTFLGARADIFSSWLYFIKKHEYYAFFIKHVLLSLKMTPTFLAKVSHPGSGTPMLHIIFRP